MGGLFKKMPVTAITMGIGVLAICGFPFTSGFYSKDAIVAQTLAFISVHPMHAFVGILPVVTAGITAFYMCRLWFLTFTGKPRDHHVYDHAHESGKVMWVPLAVLAVFAVFAGGLPGWPYLEKMIEFGQPASIHAAPIAEVTHKVHEMHATATVVASVAAGIGIALAAGMYYFNAVGAADARRHFPQVYDLLANKWYFDELYSALIVRPSLIVAQGITWVDKTLIDGFLDGSARWTYKTASINGEFDNRVIDGLVNWIAGFTYKIGDSLRSVQTGWLRGYVLYIAAGAVGLFALGSFLYR
jgi:NADH-quinone oxidoreductase subunit L